MLKLLDGLDNYEYNGIKKINLPTTNITLYLTDKCLLKLIE